MLIPYMPLLRLAYCSGYVVDYNYKNPLFPMF